MRSLAVNKSDTKKPLLQRLHSDNHKPETHVTGVYIPHAMISYAATLFIY